MKQNLHRHLLVLLFLLGSVGFLSAQYPRGGGGFGGFGKRPSGTNITDENQLFMRIHQEGIRELDDSTSRGISEFPIKVHIVSKSDGSDGVTIAQVQEAINHLNTVFLKAYIRFVPLEDYSYIKSDELFKIPLEKEAELCKPYDVRNVINLYIVNTIKSDRNTFDGFTHMPDKLPIDRIFIRQKSLNDKVTIIRQMGHYFSLYPTSGPNIGMRSEERVDGKNCETTGDEICDTPADPGLNIQTVDARCEFIGNQQDAESKFYRPLTNNIMCENPRAECLTKLTRQQYRRIMYASMYIRNYLEFPQIEGVDKKYLKTLEEKYGQKGSVDITINGSSVPIVLIKNLYKVQGKYAEGNTVELELTNFRKGYIYVFEGDDSRGLNLLYPKEDDKQFFKDEKANFKIPSYTIDNKPGANYICIMFSKKQLNNQSFLKEINNQSEEQTLFQRFYSAHGDKIVTAKDIELNNTKIDFKAVSTERYLVPIFIEFEQN